MKTFIGIFCVSFSIFWLMGFFVGKNSTDRELAVKNYIFSKLELRKYDGRLSGYYLTYKVNDEQYYMYDIALDNLKKSNSLSMSQLTTEDNDILDMPIDVDTIMKAVGGITVGFKLKDILSGTKKDKKDIVALVLGSVSGYLMGYNYGVRHFVQNNESTHKRVLNDINQWKEFEKKYCLVLLISAFDVSSVIRDVDVQDDTKDMIAVMAVNFQDKENLGNAEYKVALDQVNKTFRLSQTSLREYVKKDVGGQIWLWLQWVFLGVWIIVSFYGLYYLVNYFRSKVENN